MIHAFTIDVEDYHNIIARDWLEREGPPTRAVVDNMARILSWLADRSVRSTCFILGEVAEHFPGLVREIAAGGHELGVHGYYHRQLFKLTPESFRREVGDAKRRIEDLTGTRVRGHRAPAFSIMPNTAWGLDVLIDLGFDYDSSVFPIRGRRYGWPDFPQDIHYMTAPSGRTLIEAPLSTISLFGRRLPSCGGGYLRHFPGGFTRWSIRKVARLRPAILYMHPYEIELPCPDLETSHLAADARKRVERFHRLQRRNRQTVERKILRLMDEFEFGPLGEVIDARLNRASSAEGAAAV